MENLLKVSDESSGKRRKTVGQAPSLELPGNAMPTSFEIRITSFVERVFLTLSFRLRAKIFLDKRLRLVPKTGSAAYSECSVERVQPSVFRCFPSSSSVDFGRFFKFYLLSLFSGCQTQKTTQFLKLKSRRRTGLKPQTDLGFPLKVVLDKSRPFSASQMGELCVVSV